MASISKTANGRWLAYWKPPIGDRRKKTFDTRSQAQQWIDENQSRVTTGTYIDPKRANIGLIEWVDICRSREHSLAPGSERVEWRVRNRLEQGVLADLRLVDLSREVVSAWMAAEKTAGRSASDVAKSYTYLTKWLNLAVQMGRLTTNPCGTGRQRLKAPKPPKVEMHFLTFDELEQLADSIMPRYRAWVLLMGLMGLRFSEGNGLRRSAIDVPGRRLDVFEQMLWDQDSKEFIRTAKLKTERSTRSLQLPGSLADLLGDHMEEFALPGPDGLVFPNSNGRPLLNSSFLSGTFRPAAKRAGLDPKLRIHDLRHTSVALAIAAGAHPSVIQHRLGHSSIRMTLDGYGHLFQAVDDDLADKLDGLLGQVQSDTSNVSYLPQTGSQPS